MTTAYKTPAVGSVIHHDGRRLAVIGRGAAPTKAAEAYAYRTLAEKGLGPRSLPSAYRTAGYHVQCLETGELSTLHSGRYYVEVDADPVTPTLFDVA